MRARVLVARFVWWAGCKVPAKYRTAFLLRARDVVQLAIQLGLL